MAQVDSENSTAMPVRPAGAIISTGLVKQQRQRERALKRLAKLRTKASAEIERLIAFLDASDPYAATELEDAIDDEPSLGSFDRMLHQGRAWEARHHHFYSVPADSEVDDADAEPSLGSVGEANQERWAAGDPRGLELDGAESGSLSRSVRKTGKPGGWSDAEQENCPRPYRCRRRCRDDRSASHCRA